MQYKIIFYLISICVIYIVIGIVATYIYRLKNPLKKLVTNKKTVYLTFDDGIDVRYTPKLLDFLERENIKATFFIMASTVSENKKIIQRMKEQGHIVAFHSFDHKNQILQLPHQIKDDFKKSVKIFKDAGCDLVYYRPPWGHIRIYGLYLCKKYNLIPVHWTVIVGDWKKTITVETLCNKLLAEIKPNSVVCLHDGRGKNEAPQRTLQALEVVVLKLKGEEYNFETIDSIHKKNTN